MLADLEGPGAVTHIWITVADSEFGWPRLLRLRVYYDGSAIPSVDAPLGDFFAVGHGFERPVQSLMIRDSSDGRSRNSYWPMPFRKSCRITVTNEGRRRVAQPLLPGGLAEAARRCPPTRPTSTPATGRPCRTRAESPTRS